MPLYLIIIVCVAACLFIVVCLYTLVLFRRMSIVSKKLDFLIEDLTYKSENIGPFIDALLKVSTYVDVLDVVIKNNIDGIKKVVQNNSSNIKKFNKQLEKVLNDNAR